MHARVPLDVDLEDKLLYGLTPMRLGYLVVGLLAAFALWSMQWAPSPIRASSAVLVAAIGASAAWGQWRGRPADSWIADSFLFFSSNYRLVARRPRWWWRR